MKYQILLWDVDGTVLNFEAAEKAAIQALFLKYGFGECPDEMVEVYSDINKKYWQALERGEMTKPEILVGRFREFFALMGKDVSKAEDFNADYQLALGDTIVFCEGAREWLQKLKGTCLLAAITNGTKKAQSKKLSLSGLDRLFDCIFISEDIGIEKPNPGFFDYVYKALAEEAGRGGLSLPESMADRKKTSLVIGDSLTSDITGGNLSGIDTCWYDPKHSENPRNIPYTYRIASMSELSDILS